ncbi:MAG TPA: hypothetical protein VGM92_02215 [Candidatus Kapabacteria bacterium]
MTHRYFYYIFSFVLLAAVWSGCASSTSPSSPSGSGGNGAGGGLVLVPDTFNFGSIAVGQSHDTMVRLYDDGIDSLTFTGDGVSSTALRDSNFSVPLSIAPDHFHDIHLQFTPSAKVLSALDSIRYNVQGKSYTAFVTLEANGAGGPSGSGGTLVAIPATIDFGSIPVGQWHDTTINLVNTGNSVLTISSAMLSSFELRDTNFTNSMEIAPQAGITVHVQYNPSQAGVGSATDSLHYSVGTTSGVTAIAFSATGQAAPTAPGTGSSFTYTFVSIDTNGVSSRPTDSSYLVLSNSLAYAGKTPVLEVQDKNQGLAYYHIESNGDLSSYFDLSQIGVGGVWLTIPIGSKVTTNTTLLDTTISFPGFPLPINAVVTATGKDIGPATVTAAGHSFTCEEGSLTITLNATASGLTVENTTQTATIWYSPQITYYPKRIDANTSVSLDPSTFQQQTQTSSDSYVLKSYQLK